MHLPRKKTYNIAEAAHLLGVSTKTLRRWDTAGKLSPKRSDGGHRRYLLKDLEKFIPVAKPVIPANQPIGHELISNASAFQSVLLPNIPDLATNHHTDALPAVKSVEFVEYPNLYDQMPLANKRLISRYARVFTAILVLVIAGKVIFVPAKTALHGLAVNYLPFEYSQKLAFLAPGQRLSKAHTRGSVLAAQSLENPTFGINVDTVFRAGVNFVQGITAPTITVTDTATIQTAVVNGDATIDGNLDLAGDLNVQGDIASTADIINLFNTDVTTINFGGDSTTISIGAGGSTSTINGNLIVTGTSDLQGAVTAGSTLAVAGATTLSSTLAVSGASTLSGAITGGSSLTLAGLLDVNGTGTNDIAGTLNLSGNILASSSDLQILPAGGGISIGTGTANAADMADGDLYITDDLEVDGTIFGSFAGSVSTGFTQGSVIFTDSTGNLAADNPNFFWDDTNNRLGLGTNTPAYTLDLNGTLRVTGAVTLGDATSDTLTVNGFVGSDLIPITASTYDLGSNTRTWETLYVDNIVASNITTSATDLNGTTSSDFAINTDNATVDAEDATLTFDRGSASVNAEIRWDATVGRKWLATNATTFAINPLSEVGITYSGKAALLVNQVQNQDLITASASASTRFRVDVDGEITASGIGRVKIIDGNEYAQTCAGINAAIDDLPATGGEIFLPEGTYTCAETITIDVDNTTIRGAGVGSHINAAGSNLNPVIDMNAKAHLTLSDFKITHSAGGSGGNTIDDDDTLGRNDFFTIKNLYILNSDSTAIRTFRGSGGLIEGNIIVTADAGGIVVGQSGTGDNNRIANNHISGAPTAIDSQSGNNTIVGNLVETGAVICQGGGSSTVISNNIILSSPVNGIYLVSCSNSVVSDNVITTPVLIGINLTTTNNTTISGNRLTDDGTGRNGVSISDSDYNVISSNLISGFSNASFTAVTISPSSSVDNIFSNNQLEGTGQAQVISDTGTNTTIIHSEDGNTSIGGADASPDTTLEIFRASGTDSTFSMTDGDVDHGLTTLANTDAFLHIAPTSSTVGGTTLTSLTDADGLALTIRGVIGATDPTDTNAAIKLIGGKSNGTTGIADLGAAETVFAVANNDDANAMTIFGDGSVVVGNPTGGAQGAGTINAVAVYDDGVILTDYVFDKYFDGTVRPEDMDTHSDYQMLSIDEMGEFVANNRHLPTIAGRNEWLASGKFSLGALVTDIWETTETNSLYILELNDKYKGLAGGENEESESTQLLADIQDMRNNLENTNAKVVDQENKIAQLTSDMEMLRGQTTLATSSGMVAGVQDDVLETASDSANPSLTSLGDTVITGKLNVGLLTLDSQANSIDSIGELNIQKLALGNVKFFDGLIEFDKAGNLKLKEIQAEKFTVLGDAAGKAILQAGAKEIFINTTTVTEDSLIMVTPTSITPYPMTVTEKVAGVGFKVETSIWASEETAFDWFIVDHKETN